MLRHRQIGMLVALAIAANASLFAFGPARSAVAGTTLQGTDILGPALKNLLKPSPTSPTLPEDSTASLIESLEDFSLALGVPQDASEEVIGAGLEADVAGRLALLVDALHSCHRKAQRTVNGMSTRELEKAVREHGNGHNFGPFELKNMRECAGRVQELALETASFVAGTTATASFDLWPVLAVNRAATNDIYAHDYAVIVDTAGNDTYANNIAGNLLDVTRGPIGSAALHPAATSVGCENIPDLVAAECIVSAAVSIDTAGNDTYGLLETPRDDTKCTGDLLVRRIITHGSGFVGVGILIDAQGDDTYTAKTVSQGAGHVGGVGILRDVGFGHDTYVAIRNAQGFALVSGFGLLDDDGGNDSFDYYMPSGGVIDDTGACDDIPRQLQGTALLQGVGMLVNALGVDYYRAAPMKVQVFTTEPNTGEKVRFGHGSQGFGGLGGIGFFFDLDGNDTYSWELDETDGPRRWDDLTVLFGEEIEEFKSTGQFVDANSGS